jgi:lipopolysaccharide cholinephosphotransferase
LQRKDNRIGEYVYSPVQRQLLNDAPIGHLFYLPDTGGYNISDAPMLDIHPIDGIPRSGLLRKLQRFFAIVHYMAVYRLPTKNKGRVAHMISGILVKITPDFLFDFYVSVSRRIISAWSTDRAEEVCSLFGLAGYENECMKKELLLPYKRVSFEGHRLPVPSRDEEYLQRLYGDYAVLPPPEERYPKHAGYLRFTEALHRNQGGAVMEDASK